MSEFKPQPLSPEQKAKFESVKASLSPKTDWPFPVVNGKTISPSQATRNFPVKTFTSWTLGRITETVKAVDGGVASEIEYTNAKGEVVGYFAYGSYDPKLPYKGE